MRSRMLPKYYLSQEVFAREQDKIFHKVWLFAGLKTMLAKHNAFITRKVAGIQVVIQNFHGEIRAFENSCLHRNAMIQGSFTGCRPMACPYHGWLYGEHGEVKSIPGNRSLFLIGKAQQSKMVLRQFALKAIGNVIFINLSTNPMPIEEQFSQTFIEAMESSSNLYDGEVMLTTLHCKFNWKLMYENLRDGNHPRFVHPNSLTKDVTFFPYVDTGLAAETLRPLNNCCSDALRKEMMRFSTFSADGTLTRTARQPPFHNTVERWGNQDSYYNWLCYPNLHIACVDGGYSFTIAHHVPISPDETDMELFWFTTRKTEPLAYSSWNLLSCLHGSQRVLREDIDVLESVQSALHENTPIPTQGAYEFQNRLVERWYTTLMETEHEI